MHRMQYYVNNVFVESSAPGLRYDLLRLGTRAGKRPQKRSFTKCRVENLVNR